MNRRLSSDRLADSRLIAPNAVNLDLHKELYFFEWKRKEYLENSARLPVGILALLLGGVIVLIRTFPYSGNISSSVFFASAGVSIAFQCISIYYLARALQWHWYELHPSPEKLQTAFDLIRGRAESIEQAQEVFDANLKVRLASAAASNRSINNKTSAALHNALVSVFFSVLFAAPCLLLHTFETVNWQPASQSPRNVGPTTIQPEGSMENTNDENELKGPDSQSQQKPDEPKPDPPVPSFPPNELVRKFPSNEVVQRDGTTREKKD